MPEKHRLRDNNKNGVFKAPTGTCMGPLGHIFFSDVVQGKVYKVRANHYPANVTVEMYHLQEPIGVAVCKDVLYCAESKRNAVAFKDLTEKPLLMWMKSRRKSLKTLVLGVKTTNENQRNFFKRN